MSDNIVSGTLPVATLAGDWSGDSGQHVGPTVTFNAAGAEGSWVFTAVPWPAALGANGGFKVEDVGTATSLDTDDGSVAAAQANLPVVIPLHYTWNGSAWVRGGFTPHKLISAGSTNATSVKAAAGVVGMISVTNINAAVRYLKFYNKASAPTVGTDTPVLVLAIPGQTIGGGSNIPIPDAGIAFSTGIAYALTTGAADSDTGAVAANELIVNLGWL